MAFKKKEDSEIKNEMEFTSEETNTEEKRKGLFRRRKSESDNEESFDNDSDNRGYDEDEEEVVRSTDDIISDVVTYFSQVEPEWLNAYQTGKLLRRDLMDHVREYVSSMPDTEGMVDEILAGVEAYLWSYGILEKLIDDPDISDIRCVSQDIIRVKRNGKRETVNMKFKNEADYVSYVSRIAVKNKVNISNQNAIQTFTDKVSNKHFILRFNIATPFVNSNGRPMLHIRKIPKQKYSTEKLLELGFFTPEVMEYLKKRAVTADGILFCGKGASGKTTAMNWLLEYLPKDKSGLIIQENEELFLTNHPEVIRQHTVESRGEGRISYGLSDLARNGLLIDIDYFIIGEIKGAEAMYLLNAVYTGHKGWASVHAASSTEALDKLVDYIKYGQTYSRGEAMKMLRHLDTIVFMKDFKVAEISEVIGFDNEKQEPIYKTVYHLEDDEDDENS